MSCCGWMWSLLWMRAHWDGEMMIEMHGVRGGGGMGVV